MKLRLHLVLLVLASLVPMLISSVTAVMFFVRHEQREIEHGLIQTARALALAVDGELRATVAVLEVQAASRHVEVSDLAMLREEGDEILKIHPYWREIAFLTATGDERLTVTSPSRAPLNAAAPRETIARVIATGKPVVSDLVTGPGGSTPSIVVAVPVYRGGPLIGVVYAAIDPDAWRTVVSDRRIQGVVTILDRARTPVASSGGDRDIESAEARLVARLPRGSGVQQTTLGGVRVYSGVSYAPMSGWAVGLAMPVDTVEEPLRRSLTMMGLVAVALTTAAVGLAVYFGRRIAASIVSLAASAAAVGRGESPPALRSVVREVDAVGRAIEDASDLLQRRARDRDAARAEVEAANRAKDEFMAVLSHELRTPLNAMLGWIHLLRNGNLMPEQRIRALDAIERNTRAQSRLIEDLLDVSSIIAGKLRLNVRSTDLAQVVEAALDVARPAAQAKGVQVESRLDPDVPSVSGDPDRLQQVVGNLLSNAVKFTPRGRCIQVRLERAASHARIVVEDTGEGMSRDLVPHVFERFRQGHGDGPRRGGLGLGLAIVRHLVELHGGTVEAQSDGPGRGSRFVVDLPIAAAPDAAAADDAPERPETGQAFPALHGTRVLLVEDEVDGRDPMRIVLSGCGAEVTAVGCVSEALAVLSTARPNILVSDITLPDGDGYGLVQKIRRLVPAGSVPAVAVTANARLEDRERAFAAGFQAHLAKPVEPAELAQVIAKLSASAL